MTKIRTIPRTFTKISLRACVCCCVALMGCGSEGEFTGGSSHTIHGSLWQSFHATVTERYPLAFASNSDGAPAGHIGIDIWSVNNSGLAQYSSTQALTATNDDAPLLKPVATTKLNDDALTALKNELARFRVLSWEDSYSCATVTCVGDHGEATLEVNLNGEHKSISWPIAAQGLPNGLEAIAQKIKDLLG